MPQLSILLPSCQPVNEGKSSSMWNNEEKGGFRASSFIYGMLAFERMGFNATTVSLGLYLSLVMNFDLSASANTLTNFIGATYFLSILGAFISDSYLNKFLTCIIFGTLELMGLVLITIQAYADSLHPHPNCSKDTSGCSINGVQTVMLYGSLSILALGAGGVGGVIPAFGAEQFERIDPKKTAKDLATYFNWLSLSSLFGACIGLTFIVYVSSKSWWKGFLISFIATFIAFALFGIGKSFYRIRTPKGNSPLTQVVQVIVVAIKNQKLILPDNADELHEIHGNESVPKLLHTKQFRCLDKAAIPRKEVVTTPWTLCTVTQIEEVKVLTRMLPIVTSTIIMNTCLSQLQAFSVQQGSRMDRFIMGSSFQVPATSVPVIPLLFMCIFIPLYQFAFVPFARKFTNNPMGITQLQRIGVGLILSAVSMAIAGIVEVKRRNQSLINPMKPISVFWLSYQYGIFGIADIFTLVGLLEFFYKEAPAGMRSLSTSLTVISLSLGNFLSVILVDLINLITMRFSPSKQGWIFGHDLDKNNLNLYYWFLAILSCVNFVNYLYWASWYNYKSEDIIYPSTDHTEPRPNPFLVPEDL